MALVEMMYDMHVEHAGNMRACTWYSRVYSAHDMIAPSIRPVVWRSTQQINIRTGAPTRNNTGTQICIYYYKIVLIRIKIYGSELVLVLCLLCCCGAAVCILLVCVCNVCMPRMCMRISRLSGRHCHRRRRYCGQRGMSNQPTDI